MASILPNGIDAPDWTPEDSPGLVPADIFYTWMNDPNLIYEVKMYSFTAILPDDTDPDSEFALELAAGCGLSLQMCKSGRYEYPYVHAAIAMRKHKMTY